MKSELVEAAFENLLSRQKNFPLAYGVQDLHIFLEQHPLVHQQPNLERGKALPESDRIAGAQEPAQHESANFVAGEVFLGAFGQSPFEEPDLSVESEHLENIALAQMVANVALQNLFHV